LMKIHIRVWGVEEKLHCGQRPWWYFASLSGLQVEQTIGLDSEYVCARCRHSYRKEQSREGD
jgi:hypothetical protein